MYSVHLSTHKSKLCCVYHLSSLKSMWCSVYSECSTYYQHHMLELSYHCCHWAPHNRGRQLTIRVTVMGEDLLLLIVGTSLLI